MTILATLINSTGIIRQCGKTCYLAKTRTCQCLCGGVNHGVGRRQAIDQTREYFEELHTEVKNLATPAMQFRKITIISKLTPRDQLLHPNQSLIFYQPPMNEETKKIALALAINACLAILTGCTPPKPPPPPTPTIAKIVVIYESSQLSIEDAATLNAQDLRQWLGSRYWFRAVDVNILNGYDQPPLELRPYLAEAAGQALPRIILADDHNRVIRALGLPKSPAKIIEYVEGTSP